MYLYTINIPKPEDQNHITLIPIGDIHTGNPYSNQTKALEFRDYVLKTPHCYTIDMGDDMENVTRDSLGDIFEQQYAPYHQRQMAVDFWRPVQEAGKLLCIVDDNHASRSRKFADWHIVEDICRELKARYGGFGALLDLRIGDKQYTINVMHGKRSGRTASAALNAVIAMNQRCLADIYIRGHHHTKIVYQDAIKKLTYRKRQWILAEHMRTYAVTGSFLEWDHPSGASSYAEVGEYNITVKGCVRLKLSTDKWDVQCAL